MAEELSETIKVHEVGKKQVKKKERSDKSKRQKYSIDEIRREEEAKKKEEVV